MLRTGLKSPILITISKRSAVYGKFTDLFCPYGQEDVSIIFRRQHFARLYEELALKRIIKVILRNMSL
jgi:hypothetical protein